MVLCPAACKRRPAADQTVRHWRRLAKQGLWCHGWQRRLCGGYLARLRVRSTGVRSPVSYTPFGRRPDHEDLLVLFVPRPLLGLDPAGAVASGRVSWQACGKEGGGVSRAEGATHRRAGRRAAAHALLHAGREL